MQWRAREAAAKNEAEELEEMQGYISSLQKDLAARKARQSPTPAPWANPQQQQQQQQRSQVVANASATAPWARAKPVPWVCPAPCGMAHAASHAECYRCGAVPQLRPGSVPASVGVAASKPPALLPPAKRVNFAPPTKESLDVALDVMMGAEDGELHVELDALVRCNPELDWTRQICGPLLEQIRTLLDTAPEPSSTCPNLPQGTAEATARAALDAAVLVEEEAEADVDLGVGMSLRSQNTLAEALKAAQASVKTCQEALAGTQKVAVSLATLSRSELDKRRANIVLAHEGWLARKAKKQQAVESSVHETTEKFDSAIAALVAQRDDLVERKTKHAAIWVHHTDLIEKVHADKVKDLVQLMAEQGPMVLSAAANTSEAQDLAALRMEMQEQIRSQSEAHAALVAENNARFESAIARWERHSESLSSQLAKHVEVTSLSPTETDQRKAHADTVRKGPTPTPPLLADGVAVGRALKAVIVAGSVEANY